MSLLSRLVLAALCIEVLAAEELVPVAFVPATKTEAKKSPDPVPVEEKTTLWQIAKAEADARAEKNAIEAKFYATLLQLQDLQRVLQTKVQDVQTKYRCVLDPKTMTCTPAPEPEPAHDDGPEEAK